MTVLLSVHYTVSTTKTSSVSGGVEKLFEFSRIVLVKCYTLILIHLGGTLSLDAS